RGRLHCSRSACTTNLLAQFERFRILGQPMRCPQSCALALRACFKIPWGPVFAEKAAWRGATREHTRQRSVTEEQRSQAAFSTKTLRAAALLTPAGVGSPVTARCGDAPDSPPWPPSKSLAAGPHAILKHALSAFL